VTKPEFFYAQKKCHTLRIWYVNFNKLIGVNIVNPIEQDRLKLGAIKFRGLGHARHRELYIEDYRFHRAQMGLFSHYLTD
jgi:hypothetical protein